MRTRKIITTLLLCLAVLVITSCDNMFTTSLFKGFARDLTETMKDVSRDDLINSGTNPDVIGNQESAKAAIEALAEKDLSDITVEQGENVLKLGTAAILPTSTLMDAITSIMNAVPEDDENGATESEEDDETEIITNVITSMIASVPEMNNTAITTVLQNQEVLETGDITTVTLATLSLTASALANEGITDSEKIDTEIGKIGENVEDMGEDIDSIDPEVFVETALKGTSFEESDAMKTAIKSFYYLMQRDDFGSLMGDDSENEDSSSEENTTGYESTY